ncbi:MAG: ATP synthase F1 subunit delta [Acidobacteria bacterium]|nr:ATP synthase F1 subunit delta [Acidobacteriota bacterium]MBU4306721.1 ATP synthase F1 subunit delta [Acidobacteriota bacterium]MBU4405567.1 ATP synthase F1 subunit delta [Acidobacteriota bacterium]MCG2810322.1 ATP synthase F1 subunit delta [Candidatus Aminicenantes bacterium]
MKESSLVKRYAKALALAMDDQSEFARVKGELHDFLALLAADEKLKIGLATFLISQAEKIIALDIVNAKMNLHAKTFQFLLTVTAENRMVYLEQMVQQLPDAWYAARGIEKIIVHSAIELAGGQKERLLGKLKKALARKVVLEYRLQPELIAGISLSRGSVQYDFSLSGSLKKLRETLVGEK